MHRKAPVWLLRLPLCLFRASGLGLVSWDEQPGPQAFSSGIRMKTPVSQWSFCSHQATSTRRPSSAKLRPSTCQRAWPTLLSMRVSCSELNRFVVRLSGRRYISFTAAWFRDYRAYGQELYGPIRSIEGGVDLSKVPALHSPVRLRNVDPEAASFQSHASVRVGSLWDVGRFRSLSLGLVGNRLGLSCGLS